jgi:hypothetical protein
MGTPPPAGANQEQQQQQHDPPQQAHSGPLSSFLHNLGNLAKPATTEVLIARLGEGNVPLVQSRSCEALAKHAKESPEQMHDIKAAGGIEALEALRARTHNEFVQTAALEALVALQGPQDSHHIRHSARDLRSKMEIPPALAESDEA